jgi:hypothetical protein
VNAALKKILDTAAEDYRHPSFGADDLMILLQDAYKEALREAYWGLRDHAETYRATNVYRKARERWEASDRSDERLFHKASIHEHYARGVGAAARDIAEMLGVPEHEIERDDPS